LHRQLPIILLVKVRFVTVPSTCTFNQWVDWFMERRSKPPFRSEGNHQQNVNALKFLRPFFGELALSDLITEAIEDYLRSDFQNGRRVRTKFGVELRGTIKPATVQQEFRILSPYGKQNHAARQ
jgi:hypothetical protein